MNFSEVAFQKVKSDLFQNKQNICRFRIARNPGGGLFAIFSFVSFSVCPLYSNVVQIFRISSTAPFVINSSLLSISTATDKHLREKSKGISSIFLYFFKFYVFFTHFCLLRSLLSMQSAGYSRL